jgi:hypothetical protein
VTVEADEFFTTVKSGQRFRLVDPTGQSPVPGHTDVLIAAGVQLDAEGGLLRLFRYDNGELGAFDPAEMARRQMQFEMVQD